MMVFWVGLANIVIIFFIIFLIFKKIGQEPLKIHFLPALTIKLLAGIALGLIYKFHYGGGDTFNIFHDAVLLSEIGIQSPGSYLNLLFSTELPTGLAELFIYSNQDRALLAAKILSVFSLITRNDYWISGMYWSLFSFIGMWYLANELVKMFPHTKTAAVIGFLFFPSVIFWSSGILKESIIMGALCFMVAFFIQAASDLKKISILKVILIILFFFLLWKLKYYYLAVLLPVIIAAFLSLYGLKKIEKLRKSPWNILLIWFSFFVLILILSTTLYPSLHLNVFLQYLVQTHDTIFNLSNPENTIHFYNLKPELESIIINFPLALFSGLFRPAFWDATTFFQWITAIENLFILILSIFALKNLKQIRNPQQAVLIGSLIIYIIILATFMAFSSPNFGTLMRYKIGYLPFLVYLILIKNPVLDRMIAIVRS